MADHDHHASLTTGHYELEDLKHHDAPDQKESVKDDRPSPKRSQSWVQRLLRPHDKEEEQSPLDWGQPGELTEEEVKVFVEFRKQVENRGGNFRKTVYSFGEEEGEPFALCRWLRARKFKLDDVLLMVEQATEEMDKYRPDNFYPDPKEALGVEPHIYISQYPQLYTGVSKTGVPLFISKPGKLNVEGLTCVTTTEGILKYHWYAMMHDFASRLRAGKEADPENFTRFECVCIMDLEGLSSAQITKMALNIIKEQTRVDSLCFPETLGRMVVVNVPRFFAVTWKLIKGWIDPRTSGKVELISSRSSWEKRLLEIIDEDQLPIDYGGKSEDTRTTLMKDAPEGMKRIVTKLLSFRTHDSFVVELNPAESMNVLIFTRAKTGATFHIKDEENKKGTFVQNIVAIHTGGDNLERDHPTRIELAKNLQGPCKFKIKGESKGSRFAASAETFFVVCGIF